MNMNFNIFENDETDKILFGLCEKETELYMVGGYVRDSIMQRTCYDRDYVIKGEKATDFARKVAEYFQGYFVMLDESFDIARVVMPDKKNTLDFAGCIGNSINEDLQRRDYTINSLAYRINGQKIKLIDNFNALNDLENKTIRAVSEENLIDDPLRMLRAFRTSAQLGFKIEANTLDMIEKNAKLILNISEERINAELIKLFDSENSADALHLMKKTKLLDEIFPELVAQRIVPPNLHHHLWLIDHSIEVVKQVELRIKTMPAWFQEMLLNETSFGITRKSLLKIAALLHDIAKPATWQIDEEGRHRFINHEEIGSEMVIDVLKRLKFSKNSINYISALTKYHLYPSQLLKSNQPADVIYQAEENIMPSDKSLYRMFRKIGEDTPDVILLAIGDRLSARGPEITEHIVETNISGLLVLLDRYKESKEKIQSIPKLLSGDDVMNILNIPKGPEVGKILKALKESQISGDINTVEEAVAFIKGYEFEKQL